MFRIWSSVKMIASTILLVSMFSVCLLFLLKPVSRLPPPVHLTHNLAAPSPQFGWALATPFYLKDSVTILFIPFNSVTKLYLGP